MPEGININHYLRAGIGLPLCKYPPDFFFFNLQLWWQGETIQTTKHNILRSQEIATPSISHLSALHSWRYWIRSSVILAGTVFACAKVPRQKGAWYIQEANVTLAEWARRRLLEGEGHGDTGAEAWLDLRGRSEEFGETRSWDGFEQRRMVVWLLEQNLKDSDPAAVRFLSLFYRVDPARLHPCVSLFGWQQLV